MSRSVGLGEDQPRPAKLAPAGREPWHLVRRPGFWLALAVPVVVAVLLGLRARGPEVMTVAAVRRDIEQHLVASGRVWVPTRVQISAQNPGRVLAVAVHEGQRVTKGSLLVQMDDAEARAATVQNQAAVAQAGARLEQLRRVGAIVATEELRQADTTLARAEADLARTVKLARSGAAPAVELENAHRQVELARAQQRAAEARQLSAAPRGADSRVALTALLRAEAELGAAEVRMAETKLLALEDAVVLVRTVEPGDMVQPSRTLLVLAAGNDAPQLVFQADERNLANLRIGQKARVAADAYPERVLDATVTTIAPSVDPARGSVEIRLAVDGAAPFLKPDMTVSIDLTVGSRRAALTVPSEAVHTGSPPWLLAIERNHVVRKDLTLGIRGQGTVEVLAGLDPGATVALPEHQRLVVGQRVRAVARRR
jgi:HlyD family secretion protein